MTCILSPSRSVSTITIRQVQHETVGNFLTVQSCLALGSLHWFRQHLRKLRLKICEMSVYLSLPDNEGYG